MKDKNSVSTSKKKIIWAIDPFSDNKKAFQKSVDALKVLSENQELEILPTYVLGLNQVSWVGNIQQPELEKLRPKTYEKFIQLLKKTKLKNLTEPKIILNFESSRSSDIESLNSYVQSEKADAVILCTHARKGMGRFFLGSFAEAFIQTCRKPMLVINPKAGEIKQFKKWCFPTDFSEASRSALDSAANFFSNKNVKVKLFHQMEYPKVSLSEAEVFAGVQSWDLMKESIREEKKKLREKSKSWCEDYKKTSLAVSSALSLDPKPVDDSLVEFTKELEPDLIVMGTQADTISTLFFGSLTRQVLRNAKCPLWILHRD